jgi:hypothetical protein
MCCTDELYVRLGRVICAARMSCICGTDELMYGTDELYVRLRRVVCAAFYIYEDSRFFPPKRECLSTLLHSSASQKAVVFIITSLSNLVPEGAEVSGTSTNNCTDQEKCVRGCRFHK